MDRLEAMELFVAAVEEGSLAAAARRHGRSAATVTRAIALLEHRAGEALLFRSTRSLSLTDAGDRHLPVWRDVIAKLREIEPTRPTAELEGSIALTAPEIFGRLNVMPAVESFLAMHAKVSVRVLLLNRLVNLVGEGIDLAVRLAPLPDSTLSGIRVGEVTNFLCAAPEYLATAGTPISLADLHHHMCIGLNAEGNGDLWPFDITSTTGRRTRSIHVKTRLSVNNALAAIDVALRGQGIIQARSYQVAGYIETGRLVRLLPRLETSPVPVHVMFSSERARNRTVRALLDHMVPVLRKALSQQNT